MIKKLIEGIEIEKTVLNILYDIHTNGPINSISLEKLSYIKKFHGNILQKHEPKLMSLMGLFYKTEAPGSILEEVYNLYAKSVEEETKKQLTPVQASAYKEINKKIFFSFSAPTSAGKSHLFRELIKDTLGDIIIVVPSRALIAEYFYEVLRQVEKTTLVLQFIENVNTSTVNRRIFIITPERGIDLFKKLKEFNIQLILFDEAQISEEPVRGMRFDSFVRRLNNYLPYAKKVFAHPFIDNPEAQLNKHSVNDEKVASHKCYRQHSVGKIFIYIDNGKKFYYFSPNENCDPVQLETDIAVKSLENNGTLLVFISKDKIYKGKHLIEFEKYVNICNKITNPKALALIEELRTFIGASKADKSKHSAMIEMMERGVVIHHGSMPLKARLLVEEFIKSNFARICFATSTLNQGINMPFDVVWLDNFHNVPALTLKNIIGRSGRATKEKNSLDYGYTIIKKRNVQTFTSRLNEEVKINDHSLLDSDISDIEEDNRDMIEALKDNSFNDELHLTQEQVNRLSGTEIDGDILFILENFLTQGIPITGKNYYELKDSVRKKIKDSFKKIYIQHLRRKELTTAELTILSAAIPIMLWHIQGKSFSEIVSLRHAYLTEKDKQREIISRRRKGEITSEQARIEIEEIKVRYTPIASPIPDKNVKAPALFSDGTSVINLDYDKLVYDTYDFLDKVISLSLTDPICGALELYFNKTKDERAIILKNYIRYGTNDNMEIWLLRYGLGFEDIERIKPHVTSVDAAKIQFRETISQLDGNVLRSIERYI